MTLSEFVAAAVEALMFVPYVGFVAKLALAAVVGAQVIATFQVAATGTAPGCALLVGGLERPVAAPAVVLVLSAWLPFAVGLAWLHTRGGAEATRFFFGHIPWTKPPPAALFVEFKHVMHLVALPLTFVVGAVVLAGLSGWPALVVALEAVTTNGLPARPLALSGVAFEWLSVQPAAWLPKPAAMAVGGVLLIAFLAWSFALTYTASARVFAPMRHDGAVRGSTT